MGVSDGIKFMPMQNQGSNSIQSQMSFGLPLTGARITTAENGVSRVNNNEENKASGGEEIKNESVRALNPTMLTSKL